MLPIRIKACSESDLRMLGDLARNIQRVLPVTQADIDAAAALGKEWVVWKVIEVNDPIDNLRGGTQLVIKQNSITPGQNVRRVLIVSGPGGQTVVIGPDKSPLLLPDAIADSLSYVKAFGGTEQRNLPDNYIERQFIYMMDGSYLTTDIVPTSDMRIEFDFATTSLTTHSSGTTYMGARNGSQGNGIGLAGSPAKTFICSGFAGSTQSSATDVIVANTRYKYTWNNGVLTIQSGGSTVASLTFTPTGTTTEYLTINGFNIDGAVGGNREGIYLYSFKAWNGQGELVADYVPAVQKGTVPVVGFYDTVSKTFKTATDGTFAAGGEAVPTPDAPMDIVSNNGVLKARHQSGLPLGYTLLDYIESTGTQYIDTGYNTKTNSWFSVDFTPMVSGNKNIFGGTAISNDSSSVCLNQYDNRVEGSAFEYRWGATNTWNNIGQENIVGTRFFVEFAKNNKIYIDGVEKADLSGMTHTADTNPIWLFSRYNGNGSARFNGKIYGFKIYENNVLQMDLVPAKHNSDNVVGMYDLVSGQFFTNQGTGDFTAGTAVSDPVEIYTDGTVETIEDTIGNTATAEMLLKVGDYQDVQEILAGDVTRKVGVKVLDGTESWSASTAYGGSFFIPVAATTWGAVAGENNLCTHFSRTVFNASNNHFYVVSSAFNDATAFKQFLANQYAAGTPVIVIYPLATATTESVAGQPMQTAAGDNVLEITQASLNNLQLECEYEKTV